LPEEAAVSKKRHSEENPYKLEIMKSPTPPQLVKVLNIRAEDVEDAYRLAHKKFHQLRSAVGPERLYGEVKTAEGRIIGVFIERHDRDRDTFTFGPFRREAPDIGE
jgi:hypothetical protein